MQVQLSGDKSKGLWVEVSPEDLDRVQEVSDTRGWRLGTRYVQAVVPRAEDPCDRKTLSLHVFIMTPTPGLVVDHINADLFDNRRANLRILDAKANKEHRVERPSPGIWRSSVLGKWIAEGRVYGPDGKRAHAGNLTFLGSFDSFDEAVQKRQDFKDGLWLPSWTRSKA